jgi:hypothetical protein
MGQETTSEGPRELQIAQATTNVQATIEKVRLETVQAYVAYQQAQQEFGLAIGMVQARKDAESRPKDPAGPEAPKAATAKAQMELIRAEIAYRVAHARLMRLIRLH